MYVLQQVEAFLDSPLHFFIIKGAAGTGKTSIMKAVAHLLSSRGKSFELLAPTGRASQNLSAKTGFDATTVHSHIFSPVTDIDKACVRFVPRTNEEEMPCVYIMDESSMVSDVMQSSLEFEQETPVLSALIAFVKQGNKANKLIFVGDDCQLSPIGYATNDVAPALDANYLTHRFQLKGRVLSLSKVMRQAEGSDILTTAYEVRQMILENQGYTNWVGKHMGNYEKAAHVYLEYYDDKRTDNVAIIGWANSYVETMNKLVREKLGHTGILAKGDWLVLNRAYYGSYGYIPSGEVVRVKAVNQKVFTIAESSFMEATLCTYRQGKEAQAFVAKILLDPLIDAKSFTYEKRKALFASANRNNPAFRQSKDVRDDEYLSALSVSYGYAFTAHKAQGNEWNTVLLNTWMPDNKSLRFLYTGITRARANLFSNNAHRVRY